MNIKETIKKNLRLLLEKKGDTHSYGCAMLNLRVPKTEWDKLQSMVEEDDVYTEEDDRSYGREDEPHITLLYGLHDDIPDEEIEEVLYSEPTPKIKLTGVSLFENDKYDVLKFDFSGKILHKLNEKLSKLPNENEFPKYIPHCTIAYLKSGTGKKVVKIIEGDIESISKSILIDSYLYSKANGDEVKFELKDD